MPDSFLQGLGSDATLIFLLAIGAAFIYLFARWASGHRAEGDPQLPQPIEPVSFEEPSSAPKAFHIEPPVEGDGFVILKFYFSQFDTVPGPPDRVNFCDEVTVEVYVRETGAVWSDTYTVASPPGIREHMDQQNWDVFFSQQIFVVREYNLDKIRAAIVDHISDILAHQKEAEESLQPARTKLE